MKTAHAERHVETSEGLEKKAFTIKANGHAFRVLIDGLYSDKQRAITRELWTNAYDAHVAAGKADQPFECKLPTTLDPVFYVRDYGVSMEEHEILGLYSTVFDSSKTNTNDQVGCLGLGSKSPFAYTDNFTVTAWSKGKKRTYSAFLGSDGVPQIAKFGEEDSEDPQGIEVSFPIKISDIAEFERAARRVARGFDVKPKIVPEDTFDDFKEPDILYSGIGWKIYEYEKYSRHASKRAFAKQGCVLYPIDADAIPELSEAAKAVCHTKAIIDFPIGQLEVAASREALAYTEETCHNIRTRLNIIADQLMATIQVKIDKCKTMWEARTAYADIVSDGNLPDVLKLVCKNKLTWRGKKLESSISIKQHWYLGITVKFLGRWDLDNNVRVPATSEEIYLDFRRKEPDKIWIVIDDNPKKTGSLSRIRHWYDENKDKISKVIWVKGDERDIKRLIRHMGYPKTIMRVSNMAAPPGNRDDKSKPAEFRKWDRGQQRWVWSPITSKSEGSFYYVDTFKHQVKLPDGSHMGRDTFSVLARYLYDGEILKGGRYTLIHNVPLAHKDAIKGNPNWVNLFDFLDQYLKDNFSEKKIMQAWHQTGSVRDDPCEDFFEEMQRQGLTFKESGTNAEKAYEIYKKPKMDNADIKRYRMVYRIANTLNKLPTGFTITANPLAHTREAFLRDYPLANNLNWRYTRVPKEKADQVAAFIQYINMMDANRKGRKNP